MAEFPTIVPFLSVSSPSPAQHSRLAFYCFRLFPLSQCLQLMLPLHPQVRPHAPSVLHNCIISLPILATDVVIVIQLLLSDGILLTLAMFFPCVTSDSETHRDFEFLLYLVRPLSFILCLVPVVYTYTCAGDILSNPSTYLRREFTSILGLTSRAMRQTMAHQPMNVATVCYRSAR